MTDEVYNREFAMMSELRSLIEKHTLPPVVPGHGRSTLSYKFAKAVHAMFFIPFDALSFSF